MYAAAFVWAKILGRLEQQLTEITVSAWLDDAEVLELTDTKLVICSPTDFRREIIRTRCAPYIESAAKELFGLDIQLEVLNDAQKLTRRLHCQNPDIEPLCSQYTFDSYVEGSANLFAKQVTMAAAQNPGSELYNPLFLYGAPDVGKTHLLYAAANYLREHRPDLRVVCIKTEQFTGDLIQAIKESGTQSFREKYRLADVLLLDDVHFIAGKEATQEEFFHTFNTLYESGRQLIITSDRNPIEMPALAERLQHRFGEGVMVQIGAPDQQSRLQIAHVKAEKFGLRLSNASKEYIAASIENARQIEGVLKKLRAYQDLTGAALTEPFVQQTVDNIPTVRSAPEITPASILRQVCNYYGADQHAVLSPQRTRNTTEPRQVAMYLVRQLTNSSMDDIAAFFSRDRATVIYGIKKIDQALSQKGSHIPDTLCEIRSKIENA